MENLPEPQEESFFKKKNGKRPRIPTATKIVAKVMTEAGFSHVETAKELNINRESVARAIADSTLDRELIDKAKAVLPSKLYQIAFKLADRLQNKPDIMDKMNPYMCALVMGIMIDKARLMDGQSTENIHVKGTVAEVQATLEQIAQMKKRLAESVGVPAESMNSPIQTTGEENVIE